MTHKLWGNFLLFLLCTGLLTFCFAVISHAQDEPQALKNRIAHLGFVYPLSTNGVNAAQYKNDFSFHALVGVSGAENAFCLSGITSIVKQDAQGVMISGISNHVGGSMQGFQLAGIMNSAKNSKGVQLAGLINNAHDAGTQVAGLINIAKKVKGIQLAALINIADESDYPIGLINIIKNGEKQLGVSLDDAGSTILSFRSGGRILYGILGVGYNAQYPDARYVIESGLGAHLPIIKHFRANFEVTYSGLTDFHNDVFMKSSLKAMAAYKVSNRVELFAGPTINYSGLGNYKSSYDFFSMKNFYLGAIGGIQFNL